jgi:SAM-dependent methyltransferase
MAYSTCSSADLMNPEFERICRTIDQGVHYHRKLWEWVFIVHHLEKAGVLREGACGIGFGVGREHLPAFFASRGVDVLATDAPADIGKLGGWSATAQYADAIEHLYNPRLVARSVFDAKVRFRSCDMNALPADIGRFDFTWSSCCFEHLGNLEAGLHFVEESIERCLKPGGIAVHTTEFNLSSNDDTVTEGETVIYRKRDLEALVERLLARGHDVEPFVVAPDSHYLDGFVDVPPYTHAPHLKLQLGKYVATSAGIVVRRGS